MSSIYADDITLYGGKNSRVTLAPLADFSENAFSFRIMVDNAAVGACRLYSLSAVNRPSEDARGIDILIGEKPFRDVDICQEVVFMLADFAFICEKADVLRCSCGENEAYLENAFRENNMRRIDGSPLNCYELSRAEYLSKSRFPVPEGAHRFVARLSELQPSQLYVCESKLENVGMWFNPSDLSNFEPLPVKMLRGRYTLTDGHSRAVAACLWGLKEVPVYIDEDELDMCFYEKLLDWCDSEGVHGIEDLSARRENYKDYQRLWLKRCMEA